MMIKDADGNSVNVGGQGQSTLNTVLGAVGTAGALGMLNGGLGGLFGSRPPMAEGDRPVTRYEMSLILDGVAKDREIAELKAKQYSDEQLRLATDKQNAINLEQAVYNGTNTAAINCLKSQVQELMNMTRLVIPSANVVFPQVATQGTTTQTSQTNG